MKKVTYEIQMGYSDKLIFDSFAKAVKALEAINDSRIPSEWEARNGEIEMRITKRFEPTPEPTEEPTEDNL